MKSTSESLLSGAGAPSVTVGEQQQPTGARSKVIYYWAAFGLFMVIAQIWIFGTWLADGPEEITRFRTPGSSSWWWAQVIQVAFVVITIGATFVVGRRCLRERRFTTEAMVMIGSLSIWWQDPFYNYFRPGFFYNSNMINRESWIVHVPGVVAPYQNLQPEPLVWGFCTYFAVMAVQIFLMVWIMRKMRARWPRLKSFLLFCIVAFLGLVMDAMFEIPMIHTRIYAYPAAFKDVSIWGGTVYQLPWLHFFSGAIYFAGCAALLVFKDDRGLTVVERGAAAIRSPKYRVAAQQLAIIAFVNVVSLAYIPLVQWQILHADPFPKGFLSEQVNGVCGDQGQPYGPCPAPGVDIKVTPPGQGHPHPSQIYRQFPFFHTPAGGGPKG
jgi:Spirocyclase AveC-like